MSSRTLLLPALATLLVLAWLSSTATPARAIARFDPGPTPSPVAPQSGGRVVVDWTGLAITFPDTWMIKVKRPPGVSSAGASVLVAFGPGETSCLLDRYDPDAVESWADVGVEPVARLTIAGLLVERFDDMLGMGAPRSTAYTFHAAEFQYSLMCTSADPPVDRWLSIAETVELD